jgi:hypothetical protein
MSLMLTRNWTSDTFDVVLLHYLAGKLTRGSYAVFSLSGLPLVGKYVEGTERVEFTAVCFS